MSDERTLPATARRRAEALEHGGLPRAALLTTAQVMLVTAGYLTQAGPDLLRDAANWLELRLTATRSDLATGDLLASLSSALWAGIGLAGAVVLIAFAAAAAGELVQGGVRVSAAQFGPRPAAGWSRLLAGLSPMSLTGGFLRWAVPLVVLTGLLRSSWSEFSALVYVNPSQWLPLGSELALSLCLRLAALLLCVGGVQYAWARWRWERSLQMTPEEQRDEQRLERRRPLQRPVTRAAADRE